MYWNEAMPARACSLDATMENHETSRSAIELQATHAGMSMDVRNRYVRMYIVGEETARASFGR